MYLAFRHSWKQLSSSLEGFVLGINLFLLLFVVISMTISPSTVYAETQDKANHEQIQTIDTTKAVQSTIPQLKSKVNVTDKIVYLHDLVDNPGIKAKLPLYRSPDLGQSGTLAVADVIKSIKKAGLGRIEVGNFEHITIVHRATTIDADEVKFSLSEYLFANGYITNEEQTEVTLDEQFSTLTLPYSTLNTVKVNNINYQPRTGQFLATISIPGSSKHANMRIKGTVQDIVDIIRIRRSIQRNQILSESDLELTTVKRPKGRSRSYSTNMADLIGKASTKNLSRGAVITERDVIEPVLIKRNTNVSIQLNTGIIKLTANGKALSNGVKGELIDILNLQSNRIIQAKVQSRGVVSVPGSSLN